MNARLRSRSSWAGFLLACALLISAADALLLEASQTFFTAGFNGVYIRGAGALIGFASISLVADLLLATGIWALAAPWLARRHWTGLQKLTTIALLSLALPFSIDFVFYQLGAVVGRMVSIPILWEVSGGGLRLMLAEATLRAGPLVAVLCAAALAAAALVWSIGRIEGAKARRIASRGGNQRKGGQGESDRGKREERLGLPRTRTLFKAFAALLAASIVALVLADRFAPRVREGLTPKPSVRALVALIRFVTDVDRDGFGMLSHPGDPAPFDASRHPFALDRRANGVDENGMAGDLPTDVQAPTNVPLEEIASSATRRPDFLLIYLESFRADRLGQKRNDREITPFFNALAREGSSSEHAFVHSPYTIWSRAQLFGGRIDPYDEQDTLVDDFRALGYTVAHFSGQDDSFGDGVALMGLDRVDHFYDARQDEAQRTSRGTSAGSLQISWKLLVERVTEYLDGYDSDRPLFLYVNLVDTHFPYSHEGLDDLLEVSPLGRYEIHVDRAEQVRATYDNAVANVDLAAGRVVERFRRAHANRADRDKAILVTSDHGQALFEHEFLGHGQALTEDQTRAPFILWGVGGDWPEPLGMADVRGLLRRNLFLARESEPPRARFVPDPERTLFHFMAQIHRPHRIGLRKQSGLTSFDFDSETLALHGPGDSERNAGAQQRARAFEELIWSWEALRERVEREATDRDGRRPARPGPA